MIYRRTRWRGSGSCGTGTRKKLNNPGGQAAVSLPLLVTISMSVFLCVWETSQTIRLIGYGISNEVWTHSSSSTPPLGEKLNNHKVSLSGCSCVCLTAWGSPHVHASYSARSPRRKIIVCVEVGKGSETRGGGKNSRKKMPGGTQMELKIIRRSRGGVILILILDFSRHAARREQVLHTPSNRPASHLFSLFHETRMGRCRIHVRKLWLMCCISVRRQRCHCCCM